MKSKVLGPDSTFLLSSFNEENKLCFSLSDAKTLWPEKKEKTIIELLRDMVGKGHLLRLKSGLFHIIPFDKDPNLWFPDWHLVAQYLVGDADYYIGYYSALQIHSLITQPSLIEQVVVNRQLKPAVQKIRNVKFQYIYHNPAHFFGAKDIWIDNYNKVQCSDLEKTCIDCLFKPDYGGGIVEIAKALYKSKDKLDFDKLYKYAERFGAQVVIKRLGFLLELLNIRNPIIEKLQSIRTKAFALLDPSLEKEGKMISRWSIQQNLETDSILSPVYS